jgi:nucleoside-diphosphate-sugar epimerase
MPKISILGCGWLGLPLAKKFHEMGFLVNGSTTSEDKLRQLRDFGITPFQISLSETGITGDISNFLSAEILVIDIPPKLRGEKSERFTAKIENLIPFIESSSVKHVLFVSSTAVYADDDSIVTEETLSKPETEAEKQLLEAEEMLRSNTNFSTTILRFAGLVGEDRHPIKYLAGKENLDNPDAPINLIHKIDCIAIIVKIVGDDVWGEIFNAAAQFHPSRKEYYSAKALEYGLPVPHFDESKPSFGKTIDCSKIKEYLGYEFKVNP